MWFFKKKDKSKASAKKRAKEEKKAKLEKTEIFHQKPSIAEKFEEIYKFAYRLTKQKTLPQFIEDIDIYFISEEDEVKIHKGLVGSKPFLKWEEIENLPFKVNPTFNLLRRLGFMMSHLIRMYTEDEVRPRDFYSNTKTLRKLKLINNETLDKLLFLAEIKEQLREVDRIKDVKYEDGNGRVHRLNHIENKFKEIFYDAFEEIAAVYSEIQEPFIEKFYKIITAEDFTKRSLANFYKLY